MPLLKETAIAVMVADFPTEAKVVVVAEGEEEIVVHEVVLAVVPVVVLVVVREVVVEAVEEAEELALHSRKEAAHEEKNADFHMKKANRACQSIKQE